MQTTTLPSLDATDRVSFSHPRLSPDLVISVNPDQIVWNYGLNTAVYPTYGGEVVQILSVYFDDMTISGTVSTYSEMEDIYSWFITYMQYATQGTHGPIYDQQPVTFHYPVRGWTFQIWPHTLPGFRYGRDVVAPTWQLTAAVKEPDKTFTDQLTKSVTQFNAQHKGDFGSQIDLFGSTTADFGKLGDLVNNPWASIDGDPARKKQTVNQYVSKLATGGQGALADSFVQFVNAYNSQDLSKTPEFNPDISKKPDLTGKDATKKTGKGK